MKLKDIINKIDVWDGWRDAYNKFVPQFIEEAKNKSGHKDWNQATFEEFFERSSGQCISSLKQGYFTKEEQKEILKNWNELSPLLKQIAESQDTPLWDVYTQIQNTIRKYTKVNRRAATYRLVASLQPRLLCTIVNQKNLNELFYYLHKNVNLKEKIPIATFNWFQDSYAILNFYKENSTITDYSQLITYPWQTIEYFTKDFDKNKERDMSEISNEIDTIIELLQYKKQIILQGPPGTGKTRKAKLIALEMLGLDNIKQLKNNNQFKLIQFHPSYAYEDFVRGIVAKPNPDGEGIVYEAENKTLGVFAKEALKNYKVSTDTSTESNIEIWIDSIFEDFKNEIEKGIEEEEIKLSGDITLFKVESDCFRYGKNWNSPSRINFRDLKNLIKAVIEKRLMLSNQQMPKEFSVHAHHRYTYYNAVLKSFFDNYSYKGESFSEQKKNYVLIIDEINRANLSSVLGELIYALEYRSETVESMYNVDGNELVLPPNLFIIGTMNTADRSVGHIDYAIRRRFAFIDVLAENLKEKQGLDSFDDVLFNEVVKLFETNLSPEFEKKDVQLGHSYFIDKSKEINGVPMSIRLEYEIKPILLEYVKDGVLIGKDIKDVIKVLKPSI